MTLKSEIEALRAEIRDQALEGPTAATGTAAEPAAESSAESAGDETPDLSGEIDAFLKTLNETLDDFAEELDRYPRLTALAALGIGLAAGVVIGRTSR